MSHSRLAPSDSKRWVNCTASIRFVEDNEDRLPPDNGSVYADEGTQAHDYASQILEGEIQFSDIPEEFREYIRLYTDECQRCMLRSDSFPCPPGFCSSSPEVFIEQKVPLFYAPEDTGTVDFACISSSGIDVNDLKYGAGVPVEVENNYQLAIYAYSLICDLNPVYGFADDFPVRIRIIQPRYEGEPKIKLWTLTVEELADFCEPVRWSAKVITEHPELQVFAPSEGDSGACRWCRAKAICTARHDAMQAPLLAELEVILAEERETALQKMFRTLTENQLLTLFRNRDSLRAILNHVEEYCLEMANAGKPLPGTKLVKGRQGNSRWSDESQARVLLSRRFKQEDYLEKSLLGPAGIRKLLKSSDVPDRYKQSIEELIVRSEGKLVITTLDDPRPAVSAAVDELEVIESEEYRQMHNETVERAVQIAKLESDAS